MQEEDGALIETCVKLLCHSNNNLIYLNALQVVNSLVIKGQRDELEIQELVVATERRLPNFLKGLL